MLQEATPLQQAIGGNGGGVSERAAVPPCSGDRHHLLPSSRLRFMQELTARGIIDLRNVPGTANHADALTKHVAPKSVFREYMSRIYQVDAARYTALHREQPEQVRPVDAEVTVAPGAPRLRPTAQLLASVGGREDQLPSLRRPAAHAALLAARLVREHPSAAALAALLAARLAREHPPAHADAPRLAHLMRGCQGQSGGEPGARRLARAAGPRRSARAPRFAAIAAAAPCADPVPHMGTVSEAWKKQSCAALSTCTAEVMPVPAVVTPASVAPPMLGPGYPSDVAGDGPISACCGERWTECIGCGWVVCPLCCNVDLFNLVEYTGGRIRRERTAGCAHQHRIRHCSWLITGTDEHGRRLPVCSCHREYLKLEDSDGD